MSSERNSRLAKPRGAFTRVLSLLLLGFIVFGTTVEAAHTHGSLAAAARVIAASNFSDPATETKVKTTLLSCGDCLICQLHQNFSTALITFRLPAPPPNERATVPNPALQNFRSQVDTPIKGRAPPFIS
ncbi:MAG TPA: hypothetical protein VKC61_04680 [Pyrinomonadaceae bacterium]|nr:hypothetical protein [Pyrinomonadaceae bacterium]